MTGQIILKYQPPLLHKRTCARASERTHTLPFSLLDVRWLNGVFLSNGAPSDQPVHIKLLEALGVDISLLVLQGQCLKLQARMMRMRAFLLLRSNSSSCEGCHERLPITPPSAPDPARLCPSIFSPTNHTAHQTQLKICTCSYTCFRAS